MPARSPGLEHVVVRAFVAAELYVAEAEREAVVQTWALRRRSEARLCHAAAERHTRDLLLGCKVDGAIDDEEREGDVDERHVQCRHECDLDLPTAARGRQNVSSILEDDVATHSDQVLYADSGAMSVLRLVARRVNESTMASATNCETASTLLRAVKGLETTHNDHVVVYATEGEDLASLLSLATNLVLLRDFLELMRCQTRAVRVLGCCLAAIRGEGDLDRSVRARLEFDQR